MSERLSAMIRVKSTQHGVTAEGLASPLANGATSPDTEIQMAMQKKSPRGLNGFTSMFRVHTKEQNSVEEEEEVVRPTSKEIQVSDIKTLSNENDDAESSGSSGSSLVDMVLSYGDDDDEDKDKAKETYL